MSLEINIKRSHEGNLCLENKQELCIYNTSFDGCVHIERYTNGTISEDNRDYIHICDLDKFIQELQEVKDKALKHFGSNWPNG